MIIFLIRLRNTEEISEGLSRMCPWWRFWRCLDYGGSTTMNAQILWWVHNMVAFSNGGERWSWMKEGLWAFYWGLCLSLTSNVCLSSSFWSPWHELLCSAILYPPPWMMPPKLWAQMHPSSSCFYQAFDFSDNKTD